MIIGLKNVFCRFSEIHRRSSGVKKIENNANRSFEVRIMRQQDKRAQRRRLLQSSPFCMDNRGAKKYHIIVECILSGRRRHSCYRRKHLHNEHNPQIYQECYLTVTVFQLNFRNDLRYPSQKYIGTLPCHHTIFVVQEGYLIFCNKKFNTKTTFKQ